MTPAANVGKFAELPTPMNRTYVRRAEALSEVRAQQQTLFDHLDDQTRLGEHMAKPSMMMLGGRMSYVFDEAKGRAAGSVIRVSGSFLGLMLAVEEVVTERVPPSRKTWETRGRPRLLVIADYRMGFEITSVAPERCQLRVFIEYNLPGTMLGSALGPLLAPLYARWCINRMADDAMDHFGSLGT